MHVPNTVSVRWGSFLFSYILDDCVLVYMYDVVWIFDLVLSAPRRNHNHIWQVLMYARTIFYKISTTEPLNPEASVLWVLLSVFNISENHS